MMTSRVQMKACFQFAEARKSLRHFPQHSVRKAARRCFSTAENGELRK